jgi:hypothetical protein
MVREWRRLAQTARPENLATHSDVQDFLFGSDLLLRRHDHSVDVSGGFAGAQLVFDYTEVQGIKLPTKRRVYRCGTDDRPIVDPVMVSIDLSDIRYS